MRKNRTNSLWVVCVFVCFPCLSVSSVEWCVGAGDVVRVKKYGLTQQFFVAISFAFFLSSFLFEQSSSLSFFLLMYLVDDAYFSFVGRYDESLVNDT